MPFIRLILMMAQETLFNFGERAFLDYRMIMGTLVVLAAVGLLGLELLALVRSIPVLKILDKAGLGSRVRNLIRATALLAWLSTAIGVPIAAGVFVVMCLAHVASAIVQNRIDVMFQSRPPQPIANLQIKKRYDKVWTKLPDIKRRRARVLYGFDVWLTVGTLGILGLNRIPIVAELGLPSALLIGGFLLAVAIFLVLVVAKSVNRQRTFAKAKVPDIIEGKLIAELKKYKPQVLLYFTGNRADRYQLEQWLKPVDKLKLKTMIVVREPSNGKKFPGCKWPVVVAPTVSELEKITDLPSLKVVLYASNAAKNMHMLRNDRLQHVYLNHGDSDKASSANPYSRIYDALLVAGPAGTKRYLDIGFDGKKPAIVEVGRPQLDRLTVKNSKGGKKGSSPTVFYAPTWEGLADTVNYSSLTTLGAGLAKAAAEAKTHKLVVKLHPNTGRYDPAMNTAAKQIGEIAAKSEWVELVDKSNDLLGLFASVDVLISDVSAVVSDFLATNKPLVMTRPSSMKKKSYLEQFPIGNAATVVAADDPSAVFQAAKTAISEDPEAEARHKMKAHVHGTHPKGSQHAFNTVVERLAAGEPAIALTQSNSSEPEEAEESDARKILISLNGLQAGGAERDCIELSKALVDTGYSVTVYAQHGELRDELDDRVTYIERPKDKRRAARILREMVTKFDVINTHDLRSLAILSKVQNRPPVLAIVHNIEARRNDRAARWLLRKVPDEVIFVSESERKRVFKRQPPIGTVIRPSIGYATEFIKRLKTVKPDPDTILFCGRLSRERGPDLAIKALPLLPNTSLVIVGDGPMKGKLAKMAADLGVGSQVKMVGAVSDPYPYIAAAGAVLVPSRRDALPRIVREAAALGRPIVAADSAGVREAAADYQNIRFCDPSNVEEFVGCINDRLSAKNQARSGQVETSNWEPVLEKLDQLQARASKQSASQQTKVEHQIDLTSAYLTDDSHQQQEQRDLYRMDEVVGYQGEEPQNSGAETVERERQGQHSDQVEAKGPDLSIIDIDEHQTSPERGANDGRFDEEVGSPVQPAAEVASLVSPSSQLSVGAVSQQVDLRRDDATGSGDDLKPAYHQDNNQSGDRHKSGNGVVMNGSVANTPGGRARNASSVEPSGPVLATHSRRQSSLAELGETDGLVDLVAMHRLEPSPVRHSETEIDADESRSEALTIDLLGQPTVDPAIDVDGAPSKCPNGSFGGKSASKQPHVTAPTDGCESGSGGSIGGGAVQSIRKPKDGLFATYVAAPLAEYLVRSQLAPRKVSPNQVTMASTVCSLVGAKMLTSRRLGVKIAGANTLGLGFVLDCADGQLARLTGTERDSGMIMDELSDRAGELVLLRELRRASNATYLADAATFLLLTRHILSRLPQTKIIPLNEASLDDSSLEDISNSSEQIEDPLRPDGVIAAPFGEMVMTASQLTIGERLAITTAASMVSARLGVSTHLVLGLVGLGRDLAARQIRSTQTPGASEVVAAASVGTGLLISQKYPGRMPLAAFGPYILLAFSRLELDTSWEFPGIQAADKNRATK